MSSYRSWSFVVSYDATGAVTQRGANLFPVLYEYDIRDLSANTMESTIAHKAGGGSSPEGIPGFSRFVIAVEVGIGCKGNE